MSNLSDLTRRPDFGRALFESAPDAILAVDARGRILAANAEVERMFGWRRDELVGRPVDVLVPARMREAHRHHRAEYGAAPYRRSMGSGLDLVGVTREGAEFPVEIALSPLAAGPDTLTIAIVRDVTSRRATEERLRYLGTHDALTGLFNRHVFEQQRAQLAASRRFPISIVVADLDTLKRVNDRHGHARGDDVLRRAAQILRLVFRAEDTIARIGGDEFAVLLPQTGAEAARGSVQRLREALRENNALPGGTALGLSIGVATAEPRQSLDECLRRADEAMYRDKESRREPTPATAGA